MKRTSVLTVILLAVGFLAGCASPHDGAAASASGRPSSFILTCADAGDVLTGLHWVDWASQAFGTGIEMINTCKPSCAEGKFVSYPALVALWRPEPLPGHPGVLYFTRITKVYTANRPPLYYCQGTHTCYPLTSTFGLWSTQIDA
jgi:hypothetical protein